jgi:hypothetical protein
MKHCIIAISLLAAAGCASSHNHERHSQEHTKHHGSTTSNRSVLKTPSAIHAEHQHLHHELEAALASGGTTAARARDVAAVLLPHFEEEEAFATPPLGLLEPLARNESLSDQQKQEAIEMAERLRRDYDKMLAEHKDLTAALHKLSDAAKKENKPNQVAFAEGLILHAQNEEQILYPATLVIGEYLKQKRSK